MSESLQVAYDDNSDLTGVVDFPYHEIDAEEISESDFGKASLAFTKLLDWVWQGGVSTPVDRQGFEVRSMLTCWIFLRKLHPLSMNELAALTNRHKQSFGRWHDQFKRDFPYIKTTHMHYHDREAN